MDVGSLEKEATNIFYLCLVNHSLRSSSSKSLSISGSPCLIGSKEESKGLLNLVQQERRRYDVVTSSYLFIGLNLYSFSGNTFSVLPTFIIYLSQLLNTLLLYRLYNLI